MRQHQAGAEWVWNGGSGRHGHPMGSLQLRVAPFLVVCPNTVDFLSASRMPGHSWLVCGRPKGLLLTLIVGDNEMTHAVGFLYPVLSVPFPMVAVDRGKLSALPCVLEALLLPLLSLHQEMGKHVCTLNKDV